MSLLEFLDSISHKLNEDAKNLINRRNSIVLGIWFLDILESKENGSSLKVNGFLTKDGESFSVDTSEVIL